jgi:hypothetical protein
VAASRPARPRAAELRSSLRGPRSRPAGRQVSYLETTNGRSRSMLRASGRPTSARLISPRKQASACGDARPSCVAEQGQSAAEAVAERADLGVF